MSLAMETRFSTALQPSMTYEQTMQFMHEKGVQPFNRLHWDRGDPLLAVFREDLRWKVGKGLTSSQLPSVVRLERVERVDTTRDNVINTKGWNNYYAIDPESQNIRRVKVGFLTTIHQYFIDGCGLFIPDDTLFIPGSETEE